jgi:DNA-binding YbaB/EbfC family protein
MDLSNIMKNAGKFQEMFKELTSQQGDKVVQGKAGGDLVIAHVSLKMQVVRLELKPELFNESQEVIGELITSAVNQGLYLAQEAMRTSMAELSKKMGLPPGMGGF